MKARAIFAVPNIYPNSECAIPQITEYRPLRLMSPPIVSQLDDSFDSISVLDTNLSTVVSQV